MSRYYQDYGKILMLVPHSFGSAAAREASNSVIPILFRDGNPADPAPCASAPSERWSLLDRRRNLGGEGGAVKAVVTLGNFSKPVCN